MISQMGRCQPLNLGWKTLLFGKIFTEKCMKMKEIGPKGEEAISSAVLGSANEFSLVNKSLEIKFKEEYNT